jgi:hypothetical protein
MFQWYSSQPPAGCKLLSEVFDGMDAADKHFFDDINIFDTDWAECVHKNPSTLSSRR